MIDQENHISRVRDALKRQRDLSVEEGVSFYLGHLGNKDCLGQADIAAARDAAEARLRQYTLSVEWISIMNDGKPVSKEDVEKLKLSFDTVLPPLAVPVPQDASELLPMRMAIAAVVGAVGGMMLLTPLTRLLLGMRDTGLFVGAPLGAFSLILATWYAANSKWLRRFLIASLGVGTIIEVWSIMTSRGLLSRIWRQLGGRRTGVWRVLLYVCIIFVLVLAKRQPKYDRKGYEMTVRSAIGQWLDGAIVTASVLLGPTEIQETTRDDLTVKLVSKVQSLKQIPSENLSCAVQELLLEIRNMGFAVEGAKTFRWEANMRERYDTFGHVEQDDLVIIEREPVCFKETIREKGLVRKVRDRG